MTPARRPRDGGYAMLAAVAGIAAFAFIAFELLASNRGELLGLSAEMEKARMTAAADAGVAYAVNGLAVDDPTRRWSLTGGVHTLTWDAMQVAIRVEDERGKVPLDNIDDDQARKLFAAAGASGEQLETLVASFADWQDEDDTRRSGGAEAADYLPLGVHPRNGPLRTVDELSRLKGMTPAVMARLRPMATVFFGSGGGFSPSTANPAALGVMTAGGEDGPEVIERERELNGQRPALEINTESLKGRPLTVRVSVDDGRGGRLQRAAIIELTGNPAQPYWVRMLD